MTTKQNTQVTDNKAKAVAVPVTDTKTPTELAASQTYTKLNRAPLPAGVRAFDPSQKISIIASSNPKQPGKASAARFAIYYNMPKGFTVADYVKAVKASGLKGANYAAADVVWDSDHGFIRVEPLAPVAKVEGGK